MFWSNRELRAATPEEIEFAKQIAEKFEIEKHSIVEIDLKQFGGANPVRQVLPTKLFTRQKLSQFFNELFSQGNFLYFTR